MCENVAYIPETLIGSIANFIGLIQSDVARRLIDCWIESPGHRKNLISDTTHCGISGTKDFKGDWYFT